MKVKIVFVDLDGTIIRTKSGRVFPISNRDWTLRPGVVDFLGNHKSSGFKIILVTNQGGIHRGIVKVDEFAKKLEAVQIAARIEFDEIFVADSMKSPYRKPLSDALVKYLNKKGIIIDKEKSLMIGDAGGRETDFSDSDKMFAEGLGIKFIHAADL